MFNIKTVLSVFNEKGTLLKWLQRIEEALKGDTLAGVGISQPEDDTVFFRFLFKDGTDLNSEILTLPRGATGATGAPGTDGKDGDTITSITTQGSREVDGYTETEIDVNLSNDNSKTFTVKAKNGTDGTDGTGIVDIYTESPEYTSTEVITPVKTELTNGETKEFYINARNGADGKDGNGIVSITTLGYEQGTGEYQGYTKTNLNLDTDVETIPFSVYARNGADGEGSGVSQDEFNEFKNETENAFNQVNSNINTLNTAVVSLSNKKYYTHHIHLSSGYDDIFLTIINQDIDAFTVETLKEYFDQNNITIMDRAIPCSGWLTVADIGTVPAACIYVHRAEDTAEPDTFRVYGVTPEGTTTSYFYFESTEIVDKRVGI